MRRLWIPFWNCDAGVTLVECGVALTVVVFLGAAAFVLIVTAIQTTMTSAANVMPP